MRSQAKYIAVLTSCWALLLTGCSGSPDPPPATSTSPAPALPTSAVDVARHRDHPCEIMPKAIDERFNLTNRKEAPNQSVPPVDVQGSTCESYRSPGFAPEAILILYPAAQPAAQVRSFRPPPANLRTVAIRGFPALIWKITTTGDPYAFPLCTVYVDFAGNQALRASFHLPAGDRGDVCAGAQQVVDLALEKLVG